jgi:hypothetical protein
VRVDDTVLAFMPRSVHSQVRIALVALWLGHFCAVQAAEPPAGAAFFDEPVLRTFQFHVPPAALSLLQQSPRSYVTGEVAEAGRTFTNVGLRLRGNGSFRSLDENPNFAVKFDQFVTNQTYGGFKKLMFNNSVQDETCFAEFIATQLFRDAGLPAAQVTHARVQLNGRDLGLYVVVEAMNREFLRRHFQSSQGSLYEGAMADIDASLQQDNGPPGDQSDRKRLAETCALAVPDERGRALDRVLDVDQFVSFAAMEMLTAHWDGYVIHTNNYRLYHDPATDKFSFIPHGMDWALMRPNLSLQVPEKSIVAHAVFQGPEGRRRYRERVGTLFTNVFQVPRLLQRIDQEMAKIRTGHFASNDLARIEHGADLMRQRLLARAARASNELAGIGPVFLALDTNGVASLTEWRAYRDGGTGVMDRVTIEGRSALHIGAVGASFLPSWRSLVYLPRGSYRYEGMLKVTAPGNILVMLRTSGPANATTLGTATDWRPLTYDFEVKDPFGNDVEFVCDFRATEGDAWFDAASLRVRRLGP